MEEREHRRGHSNKAPISIQDPNISYLKNTKTYPPRGTPTRILIPHFSPNASEAEFMSKKT